LGVDPRTTKKVLKSLGLQGTIVMSLFLISKIEVYELLGYTRFGYDYLEILVFLP